MVKKIKIGGKERPVYFGMNALELFEHEAGMSFVELQKIMSSGTMSMGIIKKFVYSGLMGGVWKTKANDELDILDVGDWIDDYGFENIDVLMSIYMDSMPMLDDKNKKKVATNQTKKT